MNFCLLWKFIKLKVTTVSQDGNREQGRVGDIQSRIPKNKIARSERLRSSNIRKFNSSDLAFSKLKTSEELPKRAA